MQAEIAISNSYFAAGMQKECENLNSFACTQTNEKETILTLYKRFFLQICLNACHTSLLWKISILISQIISTDNTSHPFHQLFLSLQLTERPAKPQTLSKGHITDFGETWLVRPTHGLG